MAYVRLEANAQPRLEKTLNPKEDCGALDAFVDMTYYINLDGCVEREVNIKEQFRRAGIKNYVRMPGVRVKYEDMPTNHSIMGPFHRCNRKKYVAGSWGCRGSHLNILMDAVLKGYTRIAIFEDDVQLVDHFDQAIQGVIDELKRLPDGFRLAYLSLNESIKQKPSVPISDSFTKIHSVTTRAYGTYAYLANNQNGTLFSELIRSIHATPMEIDLLYTQLIISGLLQGGCFLAVPELALPGHAASSIRLTTDTEELDEFVNMTYYINLDKDVERRARMEQQFTALGIQNYRRMPGVEAAWADLPQPNNLLYDAPAFVSTLNELEKKDYLIRAWGCRSAHLACLQDAQKNQFRTFAVFEDTCVLPSDFKTRFGRFAQSLNHPQVKQAEDFEVAYLDLGPTAQTVDFCSTSATATAAATAQTTEKPVIRHVTAQAMGSHAYILNNRQDWVFAHIVKNVVWSKRSFHSCLNNLLACSHLSLCFVGEPALISTAPVVVKKAAPVLRSTPRCVCSLSHPECIALIKRLHAGLCQPCQQASDRTLGLEALTGLSSCPCPTQPHSKIFGM